MTDEAIPTIEQVAAMKLIEGGATIWGYMEAKAIRELQKEHPDWVEIISNMEELEHILGTKFDGTKQVPYFGAILTSQGVEALERASGVES